MFSVSLFCFFHCDFKCHIIVVSIIPIHFISVEGKYVKKTTSQIAYRYYCGDINFSRLNNNDASYLSLLMGWGSSDSKINLRTYDVYLVPMFSYSYF